MPDDAAGAYVSADGGRILVAVLAGSIGRVKSAVAGAPSLAALQPVLDYQVVGRSWTDLQAICSNIKVHYGAGLFAAGIVSLGIDTRANAVVIYATQPTNPVLGELAAKYGKALVFRLASYIHLADSSDNDAAPQEGGAGYRTWNSPPTKSKFRCSTAFPIDMPTTHQRVELTAGHCLPAYDPTYRTLFGINPQYAFGTMFTTTWYATTDRYSDWALVQGSTNDPQIHFGPPSTGTGLLKVLSTEWGNPVQGSGACTSGNTTGQICRYKVLDVDQSFSVLDPDAGVVVFVNHIAGMISDQNLDGQPDCSGVQGGDSGGAVYAAVTVGGVAGEMAKGVVSATGDCTQGGQAYYYSKLQGVRLWNGSATMPHY